MIVLVTGSRSWRDRETVRERLKALSPDFVLIHGGAPGLDTIAGEEYKNLTGREAIVVRPDYDEYFFRIAPLMRNGTMLDMLVEFREDGEEVLVIGFKDLNSITNGTNACVEGAKSRGLPLELIQKVAS